MPRLLVRFPAALWVIAVLSLSLAGRADDKPPSIRPEEARGHHGKTVSVQFEVKAAKHAVHRKTVFLDSQADFRDEKNLGIAISEKGLQDLKTQREIDAPADHFRSRTIQVVGVVVVREDRVYIDVHKASQINEIQTSAD